VASAVSIDAEEFLSWLAVERGRSRNTLDAYRRDIAAYERFLRERGSNLLAAGPVDLDAFIASHRRDGRAPSSSKRAIVTVRSLHRFLVDEGRTAIDASRDVATPRLPQPIPKALTEAEILSVLDAVVGDHAVARRDRAILEVLYGAGLRISELVGLSFGDVSLEDATIRAFGKGAKERMVPIGRCAVSALREWLAPMGRKKLEPSQWARRGDAEAVFLNQRGGRLTRQGAWLVVGRYADAAGLRGTLHPHVFRHSCATHMIEHGADIRTVQELLGHASLTTTQIYTRVSPERLRSVYDAAHPRARSSRPAASS
jgi:integrase/recombinase XerD